MLQGKVCVVTGSTAGIGKGIAKHFLIEGAKHVFINGRSAATVQKALESFQSEGFTNVSGVIADLGTAEGCNQFIADVDKSGQTIDVVVNNMGIFGTKNFFDITDEEFLNYFNVNVMSTVRISRHYLKFMLERNAGRIIVISSECGFRPIPDMIHYSMTKAAQISISRGLAELTKGTNVTVNSLLPGPTATEGLDEYIGGIATKTNKTREEATLSYFKEREPTSLLQRFLTVEEVANVAVFLASDRSSGINGAAQLVEGGVIRSI
jgi:NAD(P)-dependent dehydrogenase (short-subunit alcohol dehydrogenase family)